ASRTARSAWSAPERSGGPRGRRPVALRRPGRRPLDCQAVPGSAGAAGHYGEPVEDIDRQIVDLLVRDGRMSYTDLGKATRLSTSAVPQRGRRPGPRGRVPRDT